MVGYPVNRGGLAAFTFLTWGRTSTLALALHLEAVRQFVLAATTVATFVRKVARRTELARAVTRYLLLCPAEMLAIRQQALPPLKVAPGARTNTSPDGNVSQTRTFVAVPVPRALSVIVNRTVAPPFTTCLFATFRSTRVGFFVFTILQTRVAPAVAGALTVIGAE